MSTLADTRLDMTAETKVQDYIALLKPRVMSLVVFSGLAGLLMAPGVGDMHPLIAAIAVLCIAAGAGAAGAFNMWYDRDIDAVMQRTAKRPIPAGKIDPAEALSFSLIMALFSVMTMAVCVNYAAAGWLAFSIFFYCVIYTMILKRRTAQNIVIGGAAGAFPPVIGWAAVTGTAPVEAWALFAIIFFWTPPHFWALALFANEDYKKANVPMLPVTKGAAHTRVQILVYTLLLLPLGVLPYALGMAGLFYLVAGLALNGLFIASALQVYREKTDRAARRMFGYSIFYLFAIFTALVMNAL